MDVKRRETATQITTSNITQENVYLVKRFHNGPIKRQKSHSNTTTFNLNKISITRILADKWRYKQSFIRVRGACLKMMSRKIYSRCLIQRRCKCVTSFIRLYHHVTGEQTLIKVYVVVN